MKTLVSILSLAILICCGSDDDSEQFNYDVGFEIGVKDIDGNDLLNPENPNAYKNDEIKIFYLINDEMIEVYDENMDYPRNFFIYRHANSYRIRVFLNNSETEEIPMTYIQWNGTETDILKAKFNRTNTFVKINSVWLNEELIWTASDATEPYYEIIK